MKNEIKDKDSNQSELEVVVGTILAILWIGLALALHGAAVMLLWQWFVVPTLEVPKIPLAVGVGFALLRGLPIRFRKHIKQQGKEQADIVYFVVQPIAIICIGFIASLFV